MSWSDNERKKLEVYQNSKEYQDKLTRRLEINDACIRSNEARQLTFELCKQDPIFFIENFGWTFDPRPGREPHHFPFILYPYQEDLVRWLVDHINSGKDGLIDKSRDMGATWVIVWVFYWYWRFSDTFSGLLGSYKESLVDDKTDGSLFGKIDYAVQNTPKWILPARFDVKKHRTQMKLLNPENYNLIIGDTMNPDFSRGRRFNVVCLDEGASWQYFREAWTASGDSTPCRLTVSTPKGRNSFCNLKESGIDYLSLHWKLHPLKDAEWYEFEKSRRTDEEVAQELDISYNKSQEGRVYPEWDSVPYGNFPYEEELPLFVSWDYGKSDDTCIIWFQPDRDNKIRVVDAYANRGKLIDFYVPLITGIVPSDNFRYSKKDLEIIESHKRWKKGIHFGDPAGKQTNQVVNRSVIDVLKESGIYVNTNDMAIGFQPRKTATKLLMRKLVVNDNERTRDMGYAIENSRYPSVRRGGQEEINSVLPVHDWTSHYRTALEYFAVNFDRYKGSRAKPHDKFNFRGNKVVNY